MWVIHRFCKIKQSIMSSNIILYELKQLVRVSSTWNRVFYVGTFRDKPFFSPRKEFEQVKKFIFWLVFFILHHLLVVFEKYLFDLIFLDIPIPVLIVKNRKKFFYADAFNLDFVIRLPISKALAVWIPKNIQSFSVSFVFAFTFLNK